MAVTSPINSVWTPTSTRRISSSPAWHRIRELAGGGDENTTINQGCGGGDCGGSGNSDSNSDGEGSGNSDGDGGGSGGDSGNGGGREIDGGVWQGR